MKIQWKKLVLSMLISFLPAIFGSLFMIGSVDGWYATLNKPWFTPPNWLFGPVWTTLYILMGISLYLVLIDRPMLRIFKEQKTNGLILFGIQLFLNFLWTPVFFTFHAIIPAFLIIFLLIIVVTITSYIFHDINKKSGYLLLPYLIWLGVAGSLNFAILLLN